MRLIKMTVIIYAFLFPFIVNAQQDEDLIKWSADRKLRWTDYLAEPDSRSGAAASTSTQIGFEYHVRDNNLTYAISCKFSKTKSWGRYKNDYILSHEQGHFDIAEIFTRKLVKALKEYSFNASTYKNDLRKIYSDTMRDKEKLQQQYDNETDYSRNKPKQEEWLKKIKKMLEDYNAYTDYNQ
jgi:hypothetical protein